MKGSCQDQSVIRPAYEKLFAYTRKRSMIAVAKEISRFINKLSACHLLNPMHPLGQAEIARNFIPTCVIIYNPL